MSVRLRTLKDGTPYWQVRFRENGRETSLSWDNPTDAQRCDELIRKLGPAKARDILKIIEPADHLTLTDWCEHHINHLTGVEPGTIARYRSYLRNDIAPTIGAIPLTNLSRDDVARWMNTLLDRKPRPSGKTVANKHGFLAGALNSAVTAGHIKSNPCDGNRLPRWDRAPMVFLERDEFKILLDEIPAHWQPLVEFLVASGCRWSEATALRPANIDLTDGTARIDKAWKTGAGGYTLGPPKTRKSVRTINLPGRVLERLDLTGEWVFTNSGRGRRNPDGPVRIHSFSPNVWAPAVERAQKSGLAKKPRIHDLRHTCASWLIAAGRPLPAVQAQLGHESIAITVDVYGHLDRSSGRDNADVIDAMLS